jgi:hypothetical protein
MAIETPQFSAREYRHTAEPVANAQTVQRIAPLPHLIESRTNGIAVLPARA